MEIEAYDDSRGDLEGSPEGADRTEPMARICEINSLGPHTLMSQISYKQA